MRSYRHCGACRFGSVQIVVRDSCVLRFETLAKRCIPGEEFRRQSRCESSALPLRELCGMRMTCRNARLTGQPEAHVGMTLPTWASSFSLAPTMACGRRSAERRQSLLASIALGYAHPATHDLADGGRETHVSTDDAASKLVADAGETGHTPCFPTFGS